MDFYSLSDKAIEQELGERIKTLRLRKNLTQKELSVAAALSLNVIKSLESGRGKLSSLVAVLREMGTLDHLNSFIPAPSISPLQLARRQGRERQRASGERIKEESKGGTEW